MKRRAFIMLPSVLLASCGGGGDDAPPARWLGWYASSLGTGYYATEDLGTMRIARPPARVLAELTGASIADYSVPGGSVQLALDGGPTMPFGPFEQHIETAAIDTAIFWYGGPEAVFGLPVEPFRAGLGRLVDAALLAGKAVVLVTNPRHEGFLTALDAINAAIRDVASSRRVPLVDLWPLPYTRVDGLHPDQAYIDAAMPLVAAPL
jgi:hypothetical protein